MNIAIIPARGGSKRIPRKNIKSFYGEPVIAYAIKTALESDVFEDVIVSTDDPEIAEVAISFGARVPWLRKRQLSDDQATTMSVMQDAVGKLQSDMSDLENVCCIYPVTPLLKARDIIRGLSVLEMGQWEYVFSAMKVKTPPQRLFSLEDSKGVKMLHPGFTNSRTQDLDSFYTDAGQFYWGRKMSWISGGTVFSSKSTILELAEDLAVDVDTVDDWNYAEYLYTRQKSE
jgi:pseudaminic acid cytidylyltransferase